MTMVTLTGLLFMTISNTVSAIDIKGIWKINAGGEKGDLNIDNVSPAGQISGTIHWIGAGGPFPYTTNIFGFWDDVAMRIVFLKENTAHFDQPHNLTCNTIDNHTGEPCHHRDVIFTGYLFGGPPTGGFTNPLMMAGSSQAFGGSTGVGATAQRNVFGWCASFKVDVCGPQIENNSQTNLQSGSNMSGVG